ncbi:MAG TPA: DUF3540 domain-containing protein, partial [Wenzhouxiangellaceae bacterium]|nr:DUF3540 domain-containing protein [Wenzhouxiangellaceae bacterium]
RESAVEQCVAKVVGRTGDLWEVQANGRCFAAAVARSCLLEPMIGDRALLLVNGAESWVLSVLERPDESASRLTFPGDVGIELDHGGLSVRTRQSLNLSSAESVRIDAPVYALCATAAEHFVQGATWVGRKLVSTFESIRTVSRNMETVSNTRRDHSRHSIRSVDEVDRVTSGQIDYRSRENFTIRGKNVVAKSQELVKVDGKQIQLG